MWELRLGLEHMLRKYSAVFDKELGMFKGPDVTISMDQDATPRFGKARVIPYAIRESVEEELDQMVKEGTLTPVEYSEWAAPIVAVWKSDHQSVRICGDFRMTVNPVSKLNHYPLPRIVDLLATLAEGKIFTKLDLTRAYQQLKLSPQAQKSVVINTHKGLYGYTRLPFGISSAPGIFQKTMETLLRGIPGVLRRHFDLQLYWSQALTGRREDLYKVGSHSGIPTAEAEPSGPEVCRD